MRAVKYKQVAAFDLPASRPPAATALHFPRLLPRGALRRDLWVSTADATAFSVMVGCGETYLPAFALALGLGPVSAGLVATVPVLVGAVVQLITPYAVARMGTNRGWIVACTTVQSLSFVPLVWWAIRGRAELWQVLAAASVYWSMGMAGTPAWNSWIATLVPDRMRTTFFASRNRLGQFGIFIGFVAGGLALQEGERRGAPLIAFAALFTVAAVCRFVSTLCLAACREPKPPRRLSRDTPAAPLAALPSQLLTTIRHMRGRPSGTLVAALCCFIFGAQFCGPYFTPFMLREMGFSYHAFMLVIATAFLTKAIVLPTLGRVASRIGPARLLCRAGLLISVLALLWLPSTNVAWLVGVQVLAGTSWAGYELAVSLLFFEAVEDRDRTDVVTIYNLGLAVATVAGATCGGMLLRSLGADRTAYAVIIAVSCTLRLAAVPLLRRVRTLA